MYWTKALPFSMLRGATRTTESSPPGLSPLAQELYGEAVWIRVFGRLAQGGLIILHTIVAMPEDRTS
jgi:hypothetical protein